MLVCPPGTQSLGSGPEGVAGCANCTAGTVNPSPTNATGACKACPASTVPKNGRTCVCPAGSRLNITAGFKAATSDDASAASAWDKDDWWWFANATCVPCANGTIQPEEARALICKPCSLVRIGSISNADNTACICPAGFYAAGGDGGRRHKLRVRSCQACAAGTTTPGPGLFPNCTVVTP